MDVVLLLASFAVILAGALLFTNAIEWAGHRLAMGEGAVGSLLAAVGTAMPETLIPIVAVISGGEGRDEVAIGAILGAPFLLATLAMALVGFTALLYRRRRRGGRRINAHAPTLERDLAVFLGFFSLTLLTGLWESDAVHVAAAALCLLGYAGYVRGTLRGGGDIQAEETLAPLIVVRGRREYEDAPTGGAIAIQVLVGLGAIVGGAHLFVEELVAVAESIGVDVLVLSLVLAPLATELPEKANSFFWVREEKDTLALGNITGAMVFQSMIPVAFGLLFTDWDFDRFAVLSVVLGLAGGALAYWALRLRQRFDTIAILAWTALFAVFLVAVTLD
jgi:cation:H+ antiporter